MKHLYLCAIVLAGACITPPKAVPVEAYEETSQSFDELWANSVEWFAVRNIPIATVEKDSGIIAAEVMTGAARDVMDIADCGGLGIETPRAGQIRYNIFVRDLGEVRSVRVNTNMSIQLAGWGAVPGDWIACVSDNSVETTILADIVNDSN